MANFYTTIVNNQCITFDLDALGLTGEQCELVVTNCQPTKMSLDAAFKTAREPYLKLSHSCHNVYLRRKGDEKNDRTIPGMDI